MRRQNADIWVLTETHIGLNPGSDYQAVISETPGRPSNQGERWVVIWVRHASLEKIETTDPVRTVCTLATFSSGLRLLVYGTVLPWLGSSWQDHPAKGGEAFTAALATQSGDWQFLRRAHQNVSLVVAGDFNQDLNDRHYYGSLANRHRLSLSLSAAGLICLTSGENDPILRLTQGSRANIDHICVDKRMISNRHIDSWAWPESMESRLGLSDHFGVAIELESRKLG